MPTPRSRITDFAYYNPKYINATVAFYTVDENGDRTETLAPLYAGTTGSAQVENPQRLGSRGKFQNPVYHEAPVIGVVESMGEPSHTTGIINNSQADADRAEAAADAIEAAYASFTEIEQARDDAVAAAENAAYVATTLHQYGAVADGVTLEDVNIDVGVSATTVNSASANVTAADIGKAFMVWRAGASGQPHFTTISGINSPTSFEIADPAITSVVNKIGYYGTDNVAAFEAAETAGVPYTLGSGVYMTSSFEKKLTTFGGRRTFAGVTGQGKDISIIVKADNTDPLWYDTATGVDVYMPFYGNFSVVGGGISHGNLTETIANGSGQAPKVGATFANIAFIDKSTSGGGGGAIPAYRGLTLAKCFNTRTFGCDFNGVGYGMVELGCDNSLVMHNRFNSCRYGHYWNLSAQTFGNGLVFANNYVVGESEDTCRVLKVTNRKFVLQHNEIEVSDVLSCFDFNGNGLPAWFGTNAATGPYVFSVSGYGADIGVATGGRSYSIDVQYLYSMELNSKLWSGQVQAEFVFGSTVITSVPVVGPSNNTKRISLGEEGILFGEEWEYYEPENPYSPSDSSVMHFSGRTPDAFWPGWAGNDDSNIRVLGDNIVMQAAYSNVGLFLLADFMDGVGNETIFANGDSFEIAFLARTVSGADTLTCQYQYNSGSWTPDTASTHVLNADWTVCKHVFTAGSGTNHGVLLDRTTSVADIQIRNVNVRKIKENPQFSARVGSDTSNDKTGDGTAYVVIPNSEVVDDGDNYNAGTGVYTANEAGPRVLNALVTLANIGAGHTNARLDIVTSNRIYRYEFNPAAIVTPDARATVSFIALADMDLGDTAYLELTVYNSTKTIGVASQSLSQWGGFLIPTGGLV